MWISYISSPVTVNGPGKNITKALSIKFLFESYIIREYTEGNQLMIVPSIKGSAFITGEQEMYISDDDPFPEGYKLNDTWPKIL